MAADETKTIEELKARANELGVQYADSIGVKKLAERIAEKEKELAASTEETETEETETEETETEETETEDTLYTAVFPILHNGKLYEADKPLPKGLLSEDEATALLAKEVIKHGNNQ